MKKITIGTTLMLFLGHSLYAAASSYRVDTVAGSSSVGDGGPALYAPLRDAQGLATDRAGNIYIADPGDHRVRKISPIGIISTIAGTGQPGYTGDDGPATLARLNLPYGVTVDPSGNLFIADLGNNRVRRVTPDGIITSVSVTFKSPRNVLADSSGNIYVSEFSGGRVRRINLDLTVSTVASNLSSPAGLALDAQGALYVADSGAQVVYRATGGAMTVVLGRGSAASQLSLPTGLAVDAAQNLYVADSIRIRKLTPSGTISTIAIPARDVAIDSAGNLLAASSEHVVEQLSSGAVAMIAGDGTYRFRGDGGVATEARLNSPTAIAADKNGTLFVADTGNSRVRAVSTAGLITTFIGGPGIAAPTALSLDANQNLLFADAAKQIVSSSTAKLAGNGYSTFAGDGTPAISASLSRPSGLAAIPAGGFYIADTGNLRIRRVNAGGVITTVAGNGYEQWTGDGNAQGVTFNEPTALALTAGGILFIADTKNNRIRKLSPDGQIVTVAGGPGAQITLNHPGGLTVDPAGTLWIADTDNHRILTMSPDGTVSVAAGTGYPNFTGDGGDALSASFSSPAGLASDSAGNIYIADTGNNRIRKLTAPPAPLVETSNSGYAIVGAASLLAGAAAPCSLVTIFGSDVATAPLSFDENLTAPIASSSGSATLQVPCTATAPSVLLGVGTWRRPLPIVPAAPALFALNAGSGQAMALNSDSTPNSEVNRAARGSVVSLYATGMGLPANAAGVIVGTATADILFQGDAPGLIGVTQINIQLPGWMSGVQPVLVVSANVASQPAVTIAIQ